MARQVHTAQTTAAKGYPDPLPLAVNTADIVFVAANVANKEETVFSEKHMVLAKNSGASAHTVTISSAKDSHGRSGDISAYSVDAGDVARFGPFPSSGWRQSTGKLYFEANHAEILFAVVDIS